jgi:Major Facilitator Superfamily/Transposase, Mutator family
VALGVRADGQKVLLAIKNMRGESEAAWRALLDDLILRGLKTPEPVIVDGTGLRVVQGLCMASAFTLTLAYLGEQCSARETAGAFAAYITGNVASNLGRFMAATVADHFGLVTNFYVFAGLNLTGAILVYFTIDRAPPMPNVAPPKVSPREALAMHFSNANLRAAFAIGFCILFAFTGTFTFVNFVLVRPPIAIGMVTVGFVYFVFLPSILTTPLAGKTVARFGTRQTMYGALRLEGFLSRNGHPHQRLNPETDPEAKALIERFRVDPGVLPIVLCPGGHHRNGSHWNRHFSRSSCHDGICGACRHERSQRGQRHLSR